MCVLYVTEREGGEGGRGEGWANDSCHSVQYQEVLPEGRLKVHQEVYGGKERSVGSVVIGMENSSQVRHSFAPLLSLTPASL